ncbi:hypothetical protein KSS87_019808 [Heliosperma pusillum]|nr:hypothetical protein KSS87_019808 [Heliosperma pusillum]
MTSSTVYHKFLEVFACAHVNDGFLEGDGERMLSYFMNLQGSPLLEVKELKEKGNSLFRQNYYDRAASYYDEACKLLSLTLGDIGGEDPHILSDLAVSLNSNLAACALKLGEYKAALDLCSMILNTFPRNVKALFRRAVAFMKLKRFVEAQTDLVEALAVEPKNKDVLRELDVVKGHLLIKDNGKRVLEVTPVISVDRICKKHVHILDPAMSSEDKDSVIMVAMEDQSDLNIKDTESVNMKVTHAQSDCGSVLNSGLMKDEHISIKSVLEFSKKGGGNSRLKIPRQSYQKLLEGKKLSFYHKGDMPTISIRILNIEAPKERDVPGEKCKKKRRRRRRCSRKRESKMVIAMDEDVIDDNVIIPDVCSNTTSVCDNSSCSSSQILQESSSVDDHELKLPSFVQIDNVVPICSQAHSYSNKPPSFLFSALPKRYKRATEKEVRDFFSHCGAIEHLEIIRSGEYGCTAYVTFKDAYALETAVLLSGATIVDQRVYITRWGSYVDEYDPFSHTSWRSEDNSAAQSQAFVSTPGEAVTVAQEVVITMLAKGYDLGKDALTKAKAFDESHQVSATAVAKVAELSNRLGITDKLYAGMEVVKSVDQKYNVSETTKSAAQFTGRTAAFAATTVVNSSYFSKGALWVSDALNRASKAAANLGSKS